MKLSFSAEASGCPLPRAHRCSPGSMFVACLMLCLLAVNSLRAQSGFRVIGPREIPCCSTAPVTYCFEPDGMLGYDWTIPAGWTVVGPTNERCITLIPPKGSASAFIVGAGLDDREPWQAGFTVTRTECPSDVSITEIPCGSYRGGSITASMPDGVAPFHYSWTRNGVPVGGDQATLDNLDAGGYQVTITDANGCTSTRNVILTDPSQDLPLTATITSQQFNAVNYTGPCWAKLTMHIGGGKAPYQIDWGFGGGYGSIDSWPVSTPGTYTIKVKDARGCITTTTVSFDSCIGTMGENPTNTSNQGKKISLVALRPSVTTGPVAADFVTQHAGNVNLTVVDCNGNVQMTSALGTFSAGSNTAMLNVASLQSGVYLVILQLDSDPPDAATLVRQ